MSLFQKSYMTDPRSLWRSCDMITRLTSWHTLMAYCVLIPSPNGKQSLHTFSSPGPDHIRGDPSHGYLTFCANTSCQSKKYVLRTLRIQNFRQTNRPKCITIALLSGSEGNKFTSILSPYTPLCVSVQSPSNTPSCQNTGLRYRWRFL